MDLMGEQLPQQGPRGGGGTLGNGAWGTRTDDGNGSWGYYIWDNLNNSMAGSSDKCQSIFGADWNSSTEPKSILSLHLTLVGCF
jgi:hypothetical protein